MANPKKRKKLIVFGIIGIVLVSLALAAVLGKREPFVTIQTEKVGRRNLTELVVANGKIQPVVQVVISPEVAGEIVALPVKEGNRVKKGDLLVQIKPDNYQASRNSAEAGYKSSLAGKSVAKAELDKAETEFKRNENLFKTKLVSESVFLDFKTAYEVAVLRYENAVHAADQARFALDRATDDLSKTTIVAPIDGTVTRLRSQLGERVLGTSFNMGTEIMVVADLNEMEARVDIGESDVVLIAPGQKVRLEVDAFKDRKFTGIVTEIANSSRTTGLSSGGGMGAAATQEATKFEVKIRVQEKEPFRPGMSISSEIETRSRTNALTVPIASVTTRLPKGAEKKDGGGKSGKTNRTDRADTNVANTAASTATNVANTTTNTSEGSKTERKSKDAPKPIEVVFILDGDHVNMVPVKIGISDDSHWEVVEGVTEGQEVVSGGYKAINRELEDGKKVRKGMTPHEDEKSQKK